MRSPIAYLRGISLRLRITLTLVLTAALLSAILSVSTYLAVRTVLADRHVASSTRQSVFGLLFAREFVGSDPSLARRTVSLLQSREGFDAMISTGEAWYSTTLSLTPRVIPDDLRELVGEEQLAYERVRIGGTPMLVFGAPLPPAGVDLYLFYSLADDDRTLLLLRRVLTVTTLVVIAIAVVVGRRVSRRALHPLTVVSEAAQDVAEGLLETRVVAPSSDEVGAMAASFNQMAAALQERIERERRFVAGVSHELRTPLTTLQASSDLLGEYRSELSEPAREALGLLREDVRELRHLVEELLEMSELGTGAATTANHHVDLMALARALVERRRYDAAVGGEPVVVSSDKARLERILGNLLDNAYEHGDGADVRIVVGRGDGVARVSVADRGPGVPASERPRLFDAFYKADDSRSRDRGGIGLGLAIAEQNARLLGADIEVAETPGGGATFTLVLLDGEEVEPA